MESPFSSIITQECQSLPCLNFLSTTSGANNHTYLCSPGVMSCGLRCLPVVRKWLIPRSSRWLGLAMVPSSGHSDYATWPQCGLQCASSQIPAPGLYRVGYVCWSQEEPARSPRSSPCPPCFLRETESPVDTASAPSRCTRGHRAPSRPAGCARHGFQCGSRGLSEMHAARSV